MINKGIIHFLAIQVRIGAITMDNVPEEYKEEVQKKVDKYYEN